MTAPDAHHSARGRPVSEAARLKRRSLLFKGATGLALAGVAGELGFRLWESQSHPLTTLRDSVGASVHMQIVAHPDDCLYFINPRVAQYISQGFGLVTVVLTAGESNGFNGHGDEKGSVPDFPAYVASRNVGLRRAYAYMATGDAAHPWDREVIELHSGQNVELCTLRDNPGVQLVFCSLWTNIGRLVEDRVRLIELWEGRQERMQVLPPADSRLQHGPTVTRTMMTDTLLELLDHYRPISVNTLDVDPDRSPVEVGAAQPGFSDHIDHTATALFAWGALSKWSGETKAQTWRGYYNRHWSSNLAGFDREVKGDALDLYAWRDRKDCGHSVGCGDRVVKEDGVGYSYGPSTHPRYSNNIVVLADSSGADCYVVHGNRLRCTSKNGEAEADSPELLPALATAGDRVFGIELGLRYERERQQRNVVEFDTVTGQWRDLGNPAPNGDPARQIGVPSVASSGDEILLAARHHDGGLVTRRFNGIEWLPWQAVPSSYLHQSPTVAVDHDGEFHVFAHHYHGVKRLIDPGGSSPRWENLHLPHPTEVDPYTPSSPFAVSFGPEGETVLVSRVPDGSDLALHRETDQGWTVYLLANEGGILPPSVASAPDGQLAVLTDSTDGRPVSTIVDLEALEDEELVRLRPHGEQILAGMPYVRWSEGTFTATALAADGEIYTISSDTERSQFPDTWQRVGGEPG
ncbi:PIG-L family deacetylase [Haloglycomyces albus]|uniref:PIG-L family deacetylase n=1 Tax=Haloglycomyces albus TaxID=526067 RepID=UPI00046C9159|nr:PIG-L family deacetylase [Haloglycomyces albus]